MDGVIPLNSSLIFKVYKNLNQKGKDEITEQLLKLLNKDGRLHVVPARVKNNYIIRFTVTSFNTTEEDIIRDWNIIQSIGEQTLNNFHQDLMKEKEKQFQSSLLLSNVPQTPKFVNASFLAFSFDPDPTHDIVRELTNRDYLTSHLPLTPRKKPKLSTNGYQKGLSLDQLTPFTNFNFSSIKDKEDTSDFIEAEDLNNKLNYLSIEEKNSSKPADTSTPNGRRNFQKFVNKQASLDSKIEHIFEEVEEADAQSTANLDPE